VTSDILKYCIMIAMKKGAKTVLVGGCFDILHFGHVVFLKQAKRAGDYLIVALESDEFILNTKKKKPFHTQRERAEVLCALSFVDRVIKLPYFARDRDYFDFVKKLKPEVIAVTVGDLQIENKKKQAAEIGARVRVVTPFIKDFSSSKISKKYETLFGN